MTATTMHFGPEWMRPKHASRPQNPPSPPPSSATATHGPSSYSSLVNPALGAPQEKPDVANPFRYSKEEMVRIYKEGGGRGGLGLEVERWEGVVREVGSEPVALKEWTDAEKKLFTGSLNSEVRRRQSTDYLSPLATASGERPKLSHTGSGLASPMRERFGNPLGRGRGGPDQPTLAIPRKLSLSAAQGPLSSPRESGIPSPRTRGPLTPGFDGILNGGETWTSRRRASESASKAPNLNAVRDAGDTELSGASRTKIEEESEEPLRSDTGRREQGQNGHQESASGQFTQQSDASRTSEDPPPSNTNGLDRLSLNEQQPAIQPSASGGLQGGSELANSGPQGIPDAASIEWSYLDPQGQVQGPFRADIMQKWYEEGYFTHDLLMKRTKLDLDWISVAEMIRRAGTEQIFLVPFDNAPAPPGLPIRHGHFDAYTQPSQPRDVYNPPYQPIPTRSLHASALDGYFTTHSPASNSPSSSFGAGRFGNGSPDPATFGGRIGGHMFTAADSPVGSRSGSFVAEPASGFGIRRAGFNDSPYDQGYAVRSNIGNVGPIRTPSVDNYGISSSSITSQVPWPNPNIHPGMNGARANSIDTAGPFIQQYVDPSFSSQSPLSRTLVNAPAHHDGGYGNISAHSQRDLARLGTRDPYQPELKADGQNGIGLGGYDPAPGPSNFDAPVQSQTLNQSPSLNYAPGPSQGHVNPIAPSMSFVTNSSQGLTPAQASPSVQPPWNAIPESLPKRTGVLPFDETNVFPTSRNTISTRAVPSSQSASWAASKQPSQPVVDKDQSPWFVASQPIIDDGWGQVHGPNSLTVSNLGQHNQQQAQEAALAEQEAPVESPVEMESPQPPAEPQTTQEKAPSVHESDPSPQQSAKTRRKSTTAAATAAAAKPVSAPAQPPKAPSPTPPAASTKPVWSTEDDNKKRLSGAPMGLREIQEAEAKKQEARKAAERERERAARAAALATPQPDEAQPFTASWGLPTSQAGSARSAVPAKEAPTPSATTSPAIPGTPAPVWTNTAKPAVAKKTMKEIQEEEEKRKRAASKETAAAAARRAYAETTNKSSAPPPISGGAWTTVGSTGKSGTALPGSLPSRPALTPSASAPAVAAAASRPTNGVSAVRPPVPAVIKASASASKVEEVPVAPSADFMKWLSDSLKGLNSSVNYEETASMLLSFPLEVDATTMEIIAELVYDNSPTLDGRRFAQEFVAKRKADAAARKGAGASGRLPSIADVVKAQPKPAQQAEWGGFKVVNKKKKGGRT
ncbi:hypothetical protein BV25DRAFT_1990965 [Artomyces pyxidatus]|uniref:Uncharacterized protein n=1 Tax=Artomyces pyxidatus TaxID=48021 RepID=A0ACB8T363_9AGAM|nr:hypothetical protein BV25DRAFT_1990965 [Artomyces pyxidatus]